MKKGFRIIKFKKNRPVLQIKNISKSFDGRPILKKINIEVFPGEVVGLLGPNGSGKSSLYGCVIGQYKIDGGSIFLNGKDITEKPIHERAKLGLGYLSQFRSVFDMDTYSNLMGIAQLCIKKPEQQSIIVEKLLNEFNLQHLKNINANMLSGGESRRLQIARTLINNPKIILLDEPMAMLDPLMVEDIQKYILRLQSYGVGVIVTDHNIQNLLKIIDRAYVIGDQTIIAQGSESAILKNSRAREIFFGSFNK